MTVAGHIGITFFELKRAALLDDLKKFYDYMKTCPEHHPATPQAIQMLSEFTERFNELCREASGIMARRKDTV